MMSKTLKVLIFWVVVLNALAMLTPTLSSNDAYSYAVISKNLLQNDNIAYLTFGGMDWLDKPHLPFWLTALSFKLFGLNTFAYILPGFLFYLLGAFFTYKLAKEFFDEEKALLSALIYLTALRLELSAIDVRAEAFLQGEIMASIYYFWRYNQKYNTKELLLGAFFCALALMTKGIFIIAVVCGGFVFMWTYKKEFSNFYSLKWLGALALCFVFAVPEFIALYLQFDANPQKIVFGSQNVSGIKWFFWDSQFGRFFNTGPIKNESGNVLFFVHTFLWAFLPWTILFFYAAAATFKKWKILELDIKAIFVFLLGCFLPTFLMFSATKFQLDHYINILLPFAAIFSAYFILELNKKLQISFAIFLIIFVVAISALVGLWWQALLLFAAIIFVFFDTLKIKETRYITLSVSASVYAVLCAAIINGVLYTEYNAGYHIAKLLRKNPSYPVYGYKTYSFALEFAHDKEHIQYYDMGDIAQKQKPYYLLVDKRYIDEVKAPYVNIGEFTQIRQDRFIKSIMLEQEMSKNKETWELLLIK